MIDLGTEIPVLAVDLLKVMFVLIRTEKHLFLFLNLVESVKMSGITIFLILKAEFKALSFI